MTREVVASLLRVNRLSGDAYDHVRGRRYRSANSGNGDKLMWVWLGIAASFIFATLIDRFHGRLFDRLCDDAVQDLNGILARLGQLEHRMGEVEAKISTINERLGYEEVERRLDSAGIWEPEFRRIDSLFPHVASLAYQLERLKRDSETVFEINGLKNLDSLPAEQRSKFWGPEKTWP